MTESLVRFEYNRCERNNIITDILEKNSLALVASPIKGPFFLNISIISNKVIISVNGSCDGVYKMEFSLMPMRRIIKDYSIICSSYFEAVTNAEPRKIEAIDMGRRAAHDEGAELLKEQLGGKMEVDFETARKLFSLIYLLQEK